MTKTFNFILFLALWVLFHISVPLSVYSQSTPKFERIVNLNKPESHPNNYKSYLKKSNNELEATAAILFLGYKSFFSSQDMNSCVFTPSCSVYAIENLQHKNPIEAYLKIFDRLSRCHPLSTKGEYQYNFQTQKFYDPAY
jgi:putative membrane protein insertion efficiency factor